LPARLWKASGCRECRNTGYLGRRAIFELLTTDDEVRRLTVQRSTATELRGYALCPIASGKILTQS
jgi:type II secretory ATPase GspE/PulE/Tfp pilus assembly ATPase PilB-like protein